MKVFFKVIIALTLLTVFSSCVAPTKYYWGEYENLIYTQYQKPGAATPELQIEKMRADMQKAKSQNKPMPPGFYAHLGYQYLQLGKAAEARKLFTAEKKAFPESAVLMDRFLTKIK
jgi:hypothetical protein